ncbi:Cytochrome c-type biogenesis protein DsbD, protein-disulfide reductase [hydrothermal vent metagenome]|uniref:Cytochrome c-type biogenesis protein DsbD, protein-disulfide reductase n=1 Tax=hydrothermal vent metagenome TaxID=652676 RepID=A0A1W1EKY2_9ZZZZ
MKKMILLILLMSSIIFAFNAPLIKQEFLKPSEAFKVETIKKNGIIKSKIILGKDIHIYQDSLKFKIVKPSIVELKPSLPKAIDDNGDKIYEHEVTIDIDIKEIESKVNSDYSLSIEFSGCSSSGICYQPVTKIFDFKHSNPTKNDNKKVEDKITTIDKISNLTEGASTKDIASVLVDESFIFILFLFFIFGLLLSLTPCIFPMIPILSSIIISNSDGNPTPAKGFFISLVYVLSMAVTYTVVGVIAGVMGADIQSSMQNPWVLTIFSAIFVGLAFSLFGYYEIALPSSWQNKLNGMSNNAQGKGGIVGIAIMGLLSALIVGPCVAPPLGGAILFISHTGDALLGGMALFIMSIGMGVPLLLIGAGSGKFMPRPGGWMTKVSQFFGITMLLLAIFMISRVLSDMITMILYSLFFIGFSIYLGLFNTQKISTIKDYISKILSIITIFYGLSIFIGAISGASSIIKPFEKFTNNSSLVIESKKESHLGYSIKRLEDEIKASNKPVVVDFGKKSCTACLELETITFPNPKVKELLKDFRFIQVDLSNNTQEDKEILAKYELFGTPNIIFFDKNNKFLDAKTVTGFIAPEPFIRHLESIKK